MNVEVQNVEYMNEKASQTAKKKNLVLRQNEANEIALMTVNE